MDNIRPPYSAAKVEWKNTPSKLSEFIKEAKIAYKKKGLFHVLKTGLLMIIEYFQLWYYKGFRSKDKFSLDGKEYNYYFHARIAKTGPSWKNERAVTIPIIWNVVQEYRTKGKNVLEMGNVLSYTFKVDHDIVDKYEISDGVINKDIADFQPNKQYDLIVSVLSLQSVGWDEVPQDPPKILKAIDNLKRMLSPDGKIIIAVGWGWNQYFDNLLLQKKFIFDKQAYLKKENSTRWVEVNTIDNIKNSKYDEKIPTATAIIVGTIENKGIL
jgi:hypothetical protein